MRKVIKRFLCKSIEKMWSLKAKTKGKNLKKLVLECQSLRAFYVTLVITVLLRFNIVIIVMDIFYFIMRCIFRFHSLKECSDIRIINGNADFEEDQGKRAEYFGDVAGGIIYISFLGLIKINETIGVTVFFYGIFFIIAYFSVKKNSIFIKIIAILCSTMQGIMGIILLATYVLVVVQQFLTQQVNTGLETVVAQLDTEKKIMIFFIYYLEQEPLVTIIPMVVSIALFFIIILMTPTYQQNKLKLAFQIVNILMVLIGILSFWGVDRMGDAIAAKHRDFVVSIEQESLKYDINDMNYFENFGAENIKNLFYLIVLPYTFGILVTNIFLEAKIKYAKEKKNDILNQILIGQSEKDDNLRKQYYYWGGEKNNFNLYQRVYEISKSMLP